jgi:hypothetical protein
MELDINTPKGQTTVIEEQNMLSILQDRFPNKLFFHTPLSKPAKVDGFVITGSTITSVFESKCRQMDLIFLKERNYEWLITYEKILNGSEASKLLAVPFWGFLYLVPNNLIIMTQITDESGNFVCRFRVENTPTQYSCNGGRANRVNAYIDISKSKHIK